MYGVGRLRTTGGSRQTGVENMRKRTKTILTKGIIGSILGGDVALAIENINNLDSDDRSPLFYCLKLTDSNMLTKLIASGANLNLQDKQGWTPLHHAIQMHNFSAVKAMIDNGANIEIRDAYGNTPLWRAVFASEGRKDIIQLLLLNGADQRAKNNTNISPEDLAKNIANYELTGLFT